VLFLGGVARGPPQAARLTGGYTHDRQHHCVGFVWPGGRRTDAAGLVTTIVLGIAGALVGGFLSTTLFGWDIGTFSIAGFAVAVAGALLLLFLYHLLFRGARRSH
jgi:uncharacterized membrane protein YeaQ/YmgE (transglycosylase-associated protein family)